MLLSSAFLKALPGGYWHWYAIAAVFTVLPIAVGPRWLRVVASCGLVYAAEAFSDVGVAGIHRLVRVIPEVAKADVVICVAGFEGALASVVGGMVQNRRLRFRQAWVMELVREVLPLCTDAE